MLAAAQHVQQHPGGQVLRERFLQGQLLGPFAIVAGVGDGDAGLAHLQVVEGLDGLELDEAGAAKPCRHDVLRQLRVRAGGRSQRRLEQAPAALHAERVGGVGLEKKLAVDAEDLAALFLGQDPGEEAPGRQRRETIAGHRGSRPSRGRPWSGP